MNNSDKNSQSRTNVQIPNYQIIETIYSGSRTLVYRAVRSMDRLPVVIKLLKNDYPTFSELVQFRNQYTIAKNLNSPLIVQTYSLEPYQNSYALIVEDFGGISLQEWVLKGKNALSLMEILEIAITLCNTLDILYVNKIIHKDIKPANILINPETKQVKLIDFSIASLLPRETQEIQNANALEGTLAYLSPEQTGRMNRGIDYRTDFYALGVTLYELLTGQVPFVSDDPMELVHCHLAKNPATAHQIDRNIPLVLSEIINKLMAKNAENRYQSALGIKHDLERCLAQLQRTETIECFELGERDISDRFLIPEKLYGRETEVEALLNSFDRVSQGNAELMLVAGFSGIGKTAAVNEVHKPIVRQRGYFIKGKYDQLGRNIPFSAFVQAFRDLMGQLLSESDTQLQAWKTKILEVVGDSGQVLIDVIPELERIIGAQSRAAELSGTAAQNRFNLLMQKFVQIFTSIEHPLVMFLDDLQWADFASLKLLQLLMAETGYLLILGAYRDNEVSPVHPFILTVDEIIKTGAAVNTITLQALSLVDLNQLVADTLNCDRTIAQPLTELVYQKTQGNPFFFTQFLKALHEDGEINFDSETRYWQCDIARVRALALTDDVVEFMALQLQKLPLPTQNMLKLAACIGAQFDLNTLAIVSEKSTEDAATGLWKALQEGLIIPNTEIYKFFMPSDSASVADAAANPTYRFLHDRVQQAAYSLIPHSDRQITHLEIGTLLLGNSSEIQRQERIFDIVGHFNLAADRIIEPQARYEFATLNLQASKTAKASAAFDAALMFANNGIDRLPDTKWQDNYPLTLAMYDLAAVVAYLCSEFEQANRLISSILQNARNLLDRVSACETKILADIAQSQMQDAISTALDVLQQLGIQLPKQPTQIDILLGLIKTKLILGTKKTAQLSDLPNMKNPNALAAMRILSSTASAAYIGAPQLMPLLVFERINLSVRYGNTALSAVAYAWYGLILCGVVVDIEAGYQFGQLALQLLERFKATDLKAQTFFMTYNFISHWREPLRDTMPSLLEAYQTGLETGDAEYASWAALAYSFSLYWAGEHLTEMERTTRSLIVAIAPFNQKSASIYLQIFHQAALNLLGHSNNPSILSGESYQAAEAIPVQEAVNDLSELFLSYLHQQHLHYLFEEYAEAVEKSNAAKPYLDSCVAIFPTVIHNFYDSLARLALYPNVSSSERQQFLKQVKTNQKKLKKWASHAPSNHQHKLLLVEAEQYRILKKYLPALNLYDRAIQLAKENQYLNEEALANELAAKFYLDWGKDKIAQTYMSEAYYCYARWGAKAKVVDLETRYRQLLAPILQKQQPSLKPTETMISVSSQTIQTSTFSSNTSFCAALDLATILKASQSLSSEIELDKLLSTLLQTILENAGADKCALLMPKGDCWVIEALSQLEQPTIVLRSLTLDDRTVPVTLINRVKNTLTLAAIENAAIDPTLVADPYLLQHSPKSILCAPILNRGKLIGILYLENNLTVGAFTRDRLEVLNLLMSQAAISLENARLYARLEDKVQERTQALNQKNDQLQTTLKELYRTQTQMVQSEKMSALGQLVAGIAHEINNPVSFIHGNLNHIHQHTQNLFYLLSAYQSHYPHPPESLQADLETVELNFLKEDLDNILKSMQVGSDRIRQIVLSLRNFARLDESEYKAVNLHVGIDNTLMILQHRLKASAERPAIEIVKQYGNLPLVECYAREINQVFMNLILNAIDALEESNRNRSFQEIAANPNRIWISTVKIEHNQVQITIADNGIGIPEEMRSRLFDPFFTTKPVGKGTGLGLSISYQIITEKHGGKLWFDSPPRGGTQFAIELFVSGGRDRVKTPFR